MGILIVDDSEVFRAMTSYLLEEAGYKELLLCESAEDAFEATGFNHPETTATDIELILLDINLPGVSGLEACDLFSRHPVFCDIPIIIISGVGSIDGLDAAFSAGAIDFITKPPGRTELLARVRSALRLNNEISKRKARENELLILNQRLEEMNEALEKLSATDSLTSLPNRRIFNEFIQKEWLREQRTQRPFSVIMIDIDHFKNYNDHYGHLEGDSCLQKVAITLQSCISRAGDLLARYGGEEFVAVLPNTDKKGALDIADALHEHIKELQLPHAKSPVSANVTISIGIASVIPDQGTAPKNVIAMADEALYKAKKSGRNRTVTVANYSSDLATE